MGDKPLESVVENHTVQLSFMVGAISEMKGYLKEIANTQADLKVIMERQISHEEMNQNDHKFIHERIDEIKKDNESLHKAHDTKCELMNPKAEKGFIAYNILKWAGGIIGALMLATMMARIFGIKGS